MNGVLTYRASADPFVTWVTVLVGILVLAIGIGGFRVGMVASLGVMRVVGYGVALLCFGFLAISYFYSPRGFRVSDAAVIVDRPAGDVEIAIESVESVEPFQISGTGTIRTFGNGGLFGVYGRFYNEELGSFRIYGSRMGEAVLLRTREGPFVLTPDDSEDFANQIRTRMAARN